MAFNQSPCGSVIMEISLIAAISDNLAIGRGGDLPWHISEDLKFFKRTTSGFPVIMGRKTFESIGRPLPGRRNIVVTRGGFSFPEGVETAGSVEDAINAASSYAGKCFIIGGGSLYKASIDMADSLYITHIHTVLQDADTFFPAIDPARWTVAERSEMFTDAPSGWTFEFVKYEKRT